MLGSKITEGNAIFSLKKKGPELAVLCLGTWRFGIGSSDMPCRV